RKVQTFIHAKHEHEVIITKGTTESINIVASCYGKAFIHEGDEIIISAMEHHSNIVPWQMLCDDKGCKLRVIPMNDRGELDITAYAELFSDKTKLVSFTYVSNALGTVNPVKEMIDIAHSHQVPVLV